MATTTNDETTSVTLRTHKLIKVARFVAPDPSEEPLVGMCASGVRVRLSRGVGGPPPANRSRPSCCSPPTGGVRPALADRERGSRPVCANFMATAAVREVVVVFFVRGSAISFRFAPATPAAVRCPFVFVLYRGGGGCASGAHSTGPPLAVTDDDGAVVALVLYSRHWWPWSLSRLSWLSSFACAPVSGGVRARPIVWPQAPSATLIGRLWRPARPLGQPAVSCSAVTRLTRPRRRRRS
jgi:hypothetical protein